MAYLYRHIRLDKNEPFYIGIGSNNNYKRAYDTHKRNKIWKDIVSKSLYEVEILLDDLTWEEVCIKEIEFIKLYGRICKKDGCLSNLSLGGDGYLDPSIEVRNKLSISKMGNKNPMYGKKHSEAHKEKLRKARAGKSPVPARKLINTISGKIYKNIYEAALEYGITHRALYKRLLRKSIKTPLKFIKQ